MSVAGLRQIAAALMGGGRGLLAMDEGTPTCNRRFAAAGIPQTEKARRAYRELLVTAPELGDSISGAILFDETIRQVAEDGMAFTTILSRAGIIPGIKVDIGVNNLAGHPGEKVTDGLDGLRDRLSEYAGMGAVRRITCGHRNRRRSAEQRMHIHLPR